MGNSVGESDRGALSIPFAVWEITLVRIENAMHQP